MSAARAPSTFSGLRAQRRRAARRNLEGKLAAVCARVTQLEEDLATERLLWLSSDEVVARLHLVAPVLETRVRAAAGGERPRMEARTRALRNAAEHVFDVPAEQLATMGRSALNAAQLSRRAGDADAGLNPPRQRPAEGPFGDAHGGGTQRFLIGGSDTDSSPEPAATPPSEEQAVGRALVESAPKLEQFYVGEDMRHVGVRTQRLRRCSRVAGTETPQPLAPFRAPAALKDAAAQTEPFIAYAPVLLQTQGFQWSAPALGPCGATPGLALVGAGGPPVGAGGLAEGPAQRRALCGPCGQRTQRHSTAGMTSFGRGKGSGASHAGAVQASVAAATLSSTPVFARTSAEVQTERVVVRCSLAAAVQAGGSDGACVTIQTEPEEFEFAAVPEQLVCFFSCHLGADEYFFLRQLVSNAADATHRRRRQNFGGSDRGPSPVAGIRLVPDLAANAIIIEDAGRGVSRDELIVGLGTVAVPDTRLQHAAAPDPGTVATGKFGVGFYSAVLVSSKVRVVSKTDGDDQYVWESEAGSRSFTARRDFDLAHGEVARGTKVICYFEPQMRALLQSRRLRGFARSAAEQVGIPVRLGSAEGAVEA